MDWMFALLVALLALALVLAVRWWRGRDKRREAAEARAAEAREPEVQEVPWEICQARFEDAPPLPAYEPPTSDDTGSNRAIRRRAWHLFTGQYRRILPAMAVFALFSLAQRALNFALPAGSIAAVVGSTIAMLFAYFIQMGTDSFAVRTWRGDAPRASMLWQPFREHPGRCVWVCVAYLLIFLGATYALIAGWMLATLLLTIVSQTLFELLIFFVISFVLLCVYFWFINRIWLMFFAFLKNPQKGAVTAFRTSFAAARGNFWRAAGMMICTNWPYFLVVLAMFFHNQSVRSAGTPVPAKSPTTFVFDLIVMLLDLLYCGYRIIAQAGLADALLNEAEEDGAAQ